MCCDICWNSYFLAERLAIVSSYLYCVSACCKHCSIVCYLFSVYLYYNIFQVSRCYFKINCIFLSWQDRCFSLNILILCTVGCQLVIKFFCCHIVIWFSLACFFIWTASFNIFCFCEIVVFKVRCRRGIFSHYSAETCIWLSGWILWKVNFSCKIAITYRTASYWTNNTAYICGSVANRREFSCNIAVYDLGIAIQTSYDTAGVWCSIYHIACAWTIADFRSILCISNYTAHIKTSAVAWDSYVCCVLTIFKSCAVCLTYHAYEAINIFAVIVERYVWHTIRNSTITCKSCNSAINSIFVISICHIQISLYSQTWYLCFLDIAKETDQQIFTINRRKINVWNSMTVSVEFAAETMFNIAVFIENVSDRRPYNTCQVKVIFKNNNCVFILVIISVVYRFWKRQQVVNSFYYRLIIVCKCRCRHKQKTARHQKT